ncbi:hypothetical protein E3P99_04051 [Wallemia hederae]|uniref:DAGKc domain-containing protein n=1 Tax=Wallemia hederae TaxID=1540922 RepID=A0A4T0FBR3_9BASI|nr:hypothetical protein E3P99_04051 [Wallemia hederae]
MSLRVRNKRDGTIITITIGEHGLSVRTSLAVASKKQRGCTSCLSRAGSYDEIEKGEAADLHIDYSDVANCALENGKDVILSFIVAEQDYNLLSVCGEVEGGADDSLHALIQQIRSQARLTNGRKLKVLVNPVGGTGRAVEHYNRIVAPILAASGCVVNMQILEYKGHAFDIARTLELSWDAVVCVSGDGIPHEVWNGFLHHSDAAKAFSIPLCPIPGGSGNGISVCVLGADHGLNLSVAALNAAKGGAMPLDLMSIWQGGKRTISYLTQAAGLMAAIDVDTESLRWMGDTRFTVGYIRSLIKNKPCDCEIYIKVAEDDKAAMVERLREKSMSQSTPATHQTENTNIPPVRFTEPESDWVKISGDVWYMYAGKVPYVSRTFKQFPVAVNDDGCIDVAVQMNVSRKHKLTAMDGADRGAMFYDDSLRYYKATAYHFIPGNDGGRLATDGEQLPVLPFTVEVMPSLGRLVSPYNTWNSQF